MINNDIILIQTARRNGSPSAAQHRRSLQRGRVIEYRCESGEIVAIRTRRDSRGIHTSRKGHQVYFPRR